MPIRYPQETVSENFQKTSFSFRTMSDAADPIYYMRQDLVDNLTHLMDFEGETNS